MTDEEIGNMIRNNVCTRYGKITDKDDIETIKEMLKKQFK